MPTQDSYEVAFQLARDQLRGADISERCQKSGAVFRPREGIVGIRFIDRLYTIKLPEIAVTAGDGGDVDLRDKILILHYINTASGAPLSNELITFAQVPSGNFYLKSFRGRVIDPLIKAFGQRPEMLIKAGESLGGKRADYGDVSVIVPVFPKVSITFLLWQGDEEFPPDGNVLFDSTVGQYLPTEDIAVLCEMVVSRLRKQKL